MLYYANTVHLELWLKCPNKILGHCISDTIDNCESQYSTEYQLNIFLHIY